MKFSIAIVFVTVQFCCAGQFTIIPTGTTSPITEIERQEEFVLINGIDGYLAKCYGNCNELTNLTVVGDFDYKRENLNMIDTSTFYLTSHTEFPHHGYVFKTINGGVTWTETLDTNDILFKEFFMFDTLNGLLITTTYNAIKTENDGDTWESDSHGLIFTSASLKINDSTAVMGVTENLRYTTDKGNSWDGTSFVQSPPTDFFANTIDSVYAVTYGGIGVFFTYNFALGESAWTNRPIPDFKPFGVYALSVDEIYVVGQFTLSGTAGILKTTNLGNSWGEFDTGLSGTLNDIEFLNDSIALIGGSDGLLIKWNRNSSFDFASVMTTDFNQSIRLYPNPTHDNQYLSISVSEEVHSEVEILNCQGRTVAKPYEGVLSSSIQHKIPIELANFPDGIYYCIINLDGKQYQKKIVKI